MKHTEFRDNLISSLAQTKEVANQKRDATGNALQYAIFNAQVELLSNILTWVSSLVVEDCCHDPAEDSVEDEIEEEKSSGPRVKSKGKKQ